MVLSGWKRMQREDGLTNVRQGYEISILKIPHSQYSMRRRRRIWNLDLIWKQDGRLEILCLLLIFILCPPS